MLMDKKKAKLAALKRGKHLYRACSSKEAESTFKDSCVGGIKAPKAKAIPILTEEDIISQVGSHETMYGSAPEKVGDRVEFTTDINRAVDFSGIGKGKKGKEANIIAIVIDDDILPHAYQGSGSESGVVIPAGVSANEGFFVVKEGEWQVDKPKIGQTQVEVEPPEEEHKVFEI